MKSKRIEYYVIGDEQVNIFNNEKNCKVFNLGLMTAFSLGNQESRLDNKNKVLDIVKQCDKDKKIILSFGELDCRMNIYYQYIRDNKENDLNYFLLFTIERYLDFVMQLKEMGYKVIILGIPPASEDIIDLEVYPDLETRVYIHSVFNTILNHKSIKGDIDYIEIWKVNKKTNSLDQKYSDNGIYYNKDILPDIWKEIARRKELREKNKRAK